MAGRKTKNPLIWIRFTGAAGACLYIYEDGEKQMQPGDQVAILLTVLPGSHWDALLKSGNAEVVEE
jgi:hypothetical protein